MRVWVFAKDLKDYPLNRTNKVELERNMPKAMNILYAIDGTLYANLTNRCPCSCTFCIRNESDTVSGHDVLWLEREPAAHEVIEQLRELDLGSYSELVFCGYGEPTEAFDTLKEAARWAKGNTSLPVRINTNGQGSLINGRDITPELEGIVDSVSVSLNSPDADEYLALTRSKFGADAHPAMLEFAREAGRYVPTVVLTTVGGTITHEQERACQELCDELGVSYRIRPRA